jgi:hypothetical protein
VRIGAYILAADPTWLRSSLARYYDHIDVLVVSIASDNRGWTGAVIQATHCLDVVRGCDPRRIVRIDAGSWVDAENPMRAETAQRNSALVALGDEVDWVLQIDSDELLPSFGPLERILDEADQRGISAVEWPMRVLYRRLSNGRYLEINTRGGQACFEYPGPIAVRVGVKLVDARRIAGDFLRPVIAGDTDSLQVSGPARGGEIRLIGLPVDEAILHNSWARSPTSIRRKIAAWGHHGGRRGWVYYYVRWLPSTLTWRHMHDFHPFSRGLWPALAPATTSFDELLASEDL